MKFNRQLFKEAFKQGYKAAKRLNERKIDSFDKTYQKRGREGYFGSWADKAQKILNQGSKEANEIRQYLQELNDDRPLEQYLKPLDRFYGLYNYLFGTYSSNQRPNNSEIKEIYKTYLNADTNLDNLFDIINNTKYDDREAKVTSIRSIIAMRLTLLGDSFIRNKLRKYIIQLEVILTCITLALVTITICNSHIGCLCAHERSFLHSSPSCFPSS